MDTETLKKQGLTEIKEMIARLGGWPVVEGEGWKGEKNFTWHELSSKVAGEGSTGGDILNIGKDVQYFAFNTSQFNCRNYAFELFQVNN